MNSLDKIAVELEGVVLGSLLQDAANIDRWKLQDGDFAEPLHAEMFQAITAAYRDGKPLNALTLGALMTAQPAIGDCTVPEYVRKIFAGSVANASYGDHIALKEIGNRRRLASVGEQLTWSANAPGQSIDDAAGEAIRQLDSVLSIQRSKKTKTTIGQANREMLESLERDNGTSRLPTGLRSVDDVLGGWHRGQFAIIAGRPGMGKSMVALSLALRSASKSCGSMLFSLEMTNQEIASRALSDLSFAQSDPIPYRRAATGSMTAEQKARWAETAARYETMPLVIDDQRALTISEIASRARAQAAEFERDGGSLDVVYVDHLGLVRPSDRYRGSKVQEVGEISDGLATLAKDLDVAVVALSQLNRGTEGRDNKRPTLADLRNSGDLEQDAHVVAFCYRESYYLERMKCDAGSQEELERQSRLDMCRNTIELLIAKNRNGPTETIMMFCEPACNAVRDLK